MAFYTISDDRQLEDDDRIFATLSGAKSAARAMNRRVKANPESADIHGFVSVLEHRSWAIPPTESADGIPGRGFRVASV
jgi:hypothetical protein